MLKTRNITLNSILKNIFLIVVFGLIALFLNIINIGCPFRYITGIPDPFCGMSRAMYSLLNLDISQAFYYHPLFIIFPFYLYLLVDYINHKRHFILLFLLTIAYFIVYLFRLGLFYIP